MFITKKHLPRRTFLRGIGTAVALPLLDAMIPAATALANTAARPQPRVGYFYLPHGAIMNNTPHGDAMDFWTPKGEGSSFELGEILEPLAPFKQYMTVVSGLGNKPAVSPAVHAITPGTWLTCVHPAKSHEPKIDVSVDQIAARALGQEAAFPSLELATEAGGTGGACDRVYGCSYATTISFRSATTPLPMEVNPRKLFERLFGRGDTAEERAAISREYASVIDLVAMQTESLKRELGPRDRAVLDDYLSSVREVEQRIAKLEARDLSHLELPDAPMGVLDSFDEQLHLMFDIIVLAFQANLTRVVSFMMAAEGTNRSYAHIGVTDAFHPLSHHGNDTEKMRRLVRIQRYHSEAFGKFLGKLAELSDGEGSMLDNAILLYGSNMSNSDLHDNFPLPTAVFGKGAGTIKGGQHLRYPDHTPLANLHLTLLQRAGIDAERFGDSTGVLAEV